MLYRKIASLIEAHLQSDSNKILLIDGARQVGKTYIVRYVGQKLFENYIEINLVEDALGAGLFANVRTVEDFYLQVSMLAGDRMKEKENTLIFLDEIQAYPHLLTMLKFLAQDGRFTYIASGSLLGVTLAQTPSIPMGSIRKVQMFPLDFEEFLYANGLNEFAITAMRRRFEALEALDEATHNKVMDLKGVDPIISGYTLIAEGYPINSLYGYRALGLFRSEEEIAEAPRQTFGNIAPGDIRYANVSDRNNNNTVDRDDRTVIGNVIPRYTYGLNIAMQYKGFDLSVYLQGVSGNDIFNANNISNEGMAGAANQTTAVLDRWTGEGTSYTMPRAILNDPAKNNRNSDRWVENGSYLRIKNITLGYNFPKKWISKLTLENARIFVSCENVATITSYSGFDPEVDVNGIDNNRYPISRTFSLGLNFNF